MARTKMKTLGTGLLLVAFLLLWWTFAPPPIDAPGNAPAPGTRSERPAARPLPPAPSTRRENDAPRSLPDFLPPEARRTLALIDSHGPFPHRQDGSVFQNRERRLPSRPRGYYREYTVRTPGESDRGARRIVTGGDPPVEFWYSADHYRSFRRFEVPR